MPCLRWGVFDHLQKIFNFILRQSMGGSRGGYRGVRTPPPPEKSQKVGFLSNTSLNPLKNYKATKPDSMLGHYRHTSQTPCIWRFTGPLIHVLAFGSSLIY